MFSLPLCAVYGPCKDIAMLNEEECRKKLEIAIFYPVQKQDNGQGLYADLTIFDLDTVDDLSDYMNAIVPHVGIRYMIGNGCVAMNDKAKTNG